jgi:PadR family transcriptional regulator PadR
MYGTNRRGPQPDAGHAGPPDPEDAQPHVAAGYGIAQQIKLNSDDVLEVEEGSLYPALQRLELKGLVDSEWRMTPHNRRARFYRLSAAGRKRLVAAEADFDRLVSAVQRVLRPA